MPQACQDNNELARLREKTDEHANILVNLQSNFTHLDWTLKALNVSLEKLESAITGGVDSSGPGGLRNRVYSLEEKLKESEAKHDKRMAWVSAIVSVVVSAIGWVLGVALAK